MGPDETPDCSKSKSDTYFGPYKPPRIFINRVYFKRGGGNVRGPCTTVVLLVHVARSEQHSGLSDHLHTVLKLRRMTEQISRTACRSTRYGPAEFGNVLHQAGILSLTSALDTRERTQIEECGQLVVPCQGTFQ